MNRSRLADARRARAYAGCMRLIQKLIYAGFAAAAIASASLPAISGAERIPGFELDSGRR